MINCWCTPCRRRLREDDTLEVADPRESNLQSEHPIRLGTAATSTNCYAKTAITYNFANAFCNAFYGPFNWSSTNFFSILTNWNNAWISLNDQMIACGFDNYIKQWNTRTSSFSGLFDMVFTAVWSYIWQTQVYVAVTGIYNTLTANGNAHDIGYYTGMLISKLLQAYAPSAVYFSNIEAMPIL